MSDETEKKEIKESDFRVETSPTQHLIPDTDLTYWNDEKIVYHCQFEKKTETSYYRTLGCIVCTFFPFLCPCYAFEYFNYHDKIHSKSCFITEKNIVYREQPHLTVCRVDCCYKTGLFEQIIPLNKILEVQIQYPGRGCIERHYPVTVVKLETASNTTSPEGVVKPELIITGLRDPQSFRDALMKQVRIYTASQLTGGFVDGEIDKEKIKLLKDIKTSVTNIEKHLEKK